MAPQKTVVEVGALDGMDTARLLDGGRNRVYSFEPTPDMVDLLQKKFSNFDSYYLVPLAVDEEDGWCHFNIADVRGVSSMYEFADDAENLHPAFSNETKFKYRVMTTRLDTFLTRESIARIDYLWIDAQGNDFRVLRSLGDFINIIQEGKCEASYDIDLYSGCNNYYIDIVKWLHERGFETMVVQIGGECDVHFRRISPE